MIDDGNQQHVRRNERDAEAGKEGDAPFTRHLRHLLHCEHPGGDRHEMRKEEEQPGRRSRCAQFRDERRNHRHQPDGRQRNRQESGRQVRAAHHRTDKNDFRRKRPDHADHEDDLLHWDPSLRRQRTEADEGQHQDEGRQAEDAPHTSPEPGEQ
ncbi:hypothetical protein D9M70_551420 [compost metagenome]